MQNEDEHASYFFQVVVKSNWVSRYKTPRTVMGKRQVAWHCQPAPLSLLFVNTGLLPSLPLGLFSRNHKTLHSQGQAGDLEEQSGTGIDSKVSEESGPSGPAQGPQDHPNPPAESEGTNCV